MEKILTPRVEKLPIGWLRLVMLSGVFLLVISLGTGKTEGEFGLFALVPTLVVLGLALLTRRTLEPLLAGALAGFALIEPERTLHNFVASTLEVMQGPIMGWLILVCGLLGSLIALLQFSGATLAFSDALGKYVKRRSHALVASWLLGIAIFIDDYLNALTVSTAMRKLSDKLKISRDMLAYVVDSTSAPVCLLIPFSTWVIYLAGLIEANGLVPKGEGFNYYLSLLPYLVYPWVALLMVPLVAYGVIPLFGYMKKAEQECLEGKNAPVEEDEPGHLQPPRLVNFIMPVLTLLLATWYFDIDALMGVGCALVVSLVLYRLQGLASLPRLFDEIIQGMATMLLPLGIVFAAFVLQAVNEQLGLAPYLIDTITPYMNARWLPALSFLVLAGLTFATGSFWGVYAIAFPIMIPLAQALDANMALTLGALVSAGAFGSHACFFGDSTVISARGCGISPMQHALSQLPYTLIAATVTTLLLWLMA
ncbi:Na+/H+ antiporter NhaC family protein [Oceanisphaera sediminis]|uniref:Na+/H+ antiporter NhaC family protein n=1 Tax=Oceanisphaera sediminis TaxID=981381 RepID=A0ABP7DVW5_9GAMM